MSQEYVDLKFCWICYFHHSQRLPISICISSIKNRNKTQKHCNLLVTRALGQALEELAPVPFSDALISSVTWHESLKLPVSLGPLTSYLTKLLVDTVSRLGIQACSRIEHTYHALYEDCFSKSMR